MYSIKKHLTPEYIPMKVNYAFVATVGICKYDMALTENMDGCICGLLEFAGQEQR
jgi:hypothetical protein